MANCFDVANYFITVTARSEGDFITNLKLQKLMYYAQGFHLALHDKPLFPEQVEAWMYGPVVPKVYHHFKTYGNGPLLPPEDFKLDALELLEQGLLREVQETYGQYSAWKLAQMTHEEAPWKDVVNRPGEITHEALTAYFKTQITA